jgi:hypothetical protein
MVHCLTSCDYVPVHCTSNLLTWQSDESTLGCHNFDILKSFDLRLPFSFAGEKVYACWKFGLKMSSGMGPHLWQFFFGGVEAV